MPAPTSTISPDPSWPSTIGTGRGRSPLISDRSEWQRPAPPTLTNTSPSPGGSSSISSTWMGFDLANGRGAPQTVSTPAFIFIDMALLQQTPAVSPRFARPLSIPPSARTSQALGYLDAIYSTTTAAVTTS